MPEAEIRPVKHLPSQGGEEPPLTVLSEGDFLKGQLEMRGDGRLMGNFEGEVECGGELLVGPEAQVDANIRAMHVTISGMVGGNIQARGRLKITATGRLRGDAEVASLVVQEGGVHYGTLRVHPEGLPELPETPAVGTAHPLPQMEPLPAPEVLQPSSPSLAKPFSASVGRVKRMWGEFF
jgi:cytoskeletal protein CcmA (bactofilin family)